MGEIELRTMEIEEQVLGSHHLDALVGLGTLVWLHNYQGLWKQAEDLGNQTVNTRKNFLGVEEPDILLSPQQPKPVQREEELLVQVVQVREWVLEKDHPHASQPCRRSP